ncbi:biofilm/acid-resistance regulator YmgB/AriR [Erwinia sp. BNK-24-b]|uniref:biofilm/acid-resistance regulator YmgB/AriR n=1 Tax=Erwinia TaxID=551 RepID=UPI001FEFDF51|nr:biofilm/acid-resistance regulator YmgB/AriR [Erwinia phyllosphaerae]MBV4366016.1 transcriptional regulator [Erwinia phyllosphaerae]
MQQQSSESGILEHFQKEGELLAQETKVIGAVIREIVAAGGYVTNKSIILKLIEKLENTSDVVQLDIYRQALEVVVARTPDDA